MKVLQYLITGGNRGLGLALCERYHASKDFSRAHGYDITTAQGRQLLTTASLDHDVFVNNAFDGPFQESWANFGQTRLLHDVATAWQQQQKPGWIINIGSVGSEDCVAPDPAWETYRVAKTALKEHSRQWTRAFKQNRVLFRTTLITPDRLDTPLSRSRANWTGNGHDLDDIADMIDLCIGMQGNTCVGEITAWVNFDYNY